jgi:hypothetical protein
MIGWVMTLCGQLVGGGNISDEHTDFIFRAEVRTSENSGYFEEG